MTTSVATPDSAPVTPSPLFSSAARRISEYLLLGPHHSTLEAQERIARLIEESVEPMGKRAAPAGEVIATIPVGEVVVEGAARPAHVPSARAIGGFITRMEELHRQVTTLEAQNQRLRDLNARLFEEARGYKNANALLGLQVRDLMGHLRKVDPQGVTGLDDESGAA